MPRTKPAISRPPVMLSRIAYSSATLSGLLRSGSARPSTAIRARLVVLVHAQDIEAELVAKLELVQIAVVKEMALLGIVIAVRQRHPGRRIFLVKRQVERRIRHQMKQAELHDACSVAKR